MPTLSTEQSLTIDEYGRAAERLAVAVMRAKNHAIDSTNEPAWVINHDLTDARHEFRLAEHQFQQVFGVKPDTATLELVLGGLAS